MKMSVIGTGYLGATHAVCMADLGHEVVGIDVDASKIERLSNGSTPFFEPGLDELLETSLSSGRLRFSTSFEVAAKFANVHFIGVGTPQKAGSNAADMTFVEGAIQSLVPLLRGKHVILGKSTVPVGTADRLQSLAEELCQEDTSVEIAWNPEFLREGHAVKDTIAPDRIVLGIAEDDSRVTELVREIYAKPLKDGTPLIVSDLPTAELVKVSANAFLATKISFINAVSEICELTGADITVLADAIGKDERIGRKFLGAGLGFGGGCLPKDIRAFMARAAEIGADDALTFLREVDLINLRRRDKVIDLAHKSLGGEITGQTISVLGLAFKPNSDDVRDSPALDIAGKLSLAGANVRAYDPKAIDNAKAISPTIEYCENLASVAADSSLVILATEWTEFAEMRPDQLSNLVQDRNIIDCRNVLPKRKWHEAGWNISSLGSGRNN